MLLTGAWYRGTVSCCLQLLEEAYGSRFYVGVPLAGCARGGVMGEAAQRECPRQCHPLRRHLSPGLGWTLGEALPL